MKNDCTNKQYVNLPYSTLQSDGWVRVMTECANLYKEVEKAFQEVKANALQNANAAI